MATTPKTLKITYYALFREQAARHQETFETDASTIRALYHILQKRYLFTLSESLLKAARNDQWVDLDTELTDGDKIVFIPPVSGG